MRKSLYCKACRIRLTAPLAIRSGKDPAVRMPEIVDREPIVAPGIAFKAWTAVPWVYREPGEPLNFVPQYWLNPADLTDVVTILRGRGRSHGCCGITGFDGPNQLCRCKAEIGTLQDDCMTPKVFIPEPDATEWVEGDGDYWNYP
jgi:hypothetical protein